MNYYNIGKILNTHGIKGELKIESISDFNRFEVGKTIYILRNKEYIPVVIFSHRNHKQYDLVSFVSYQDINMVLDFKGCQLFIDEEMQEALPSGEYYYHEIIGKSVLNEEGKLCGVVSDVIPYPQGPLMELKKEDGKKSLVPFNDFFIKEVGDKIIIHEIEGLL